MTASPASSPDRSVGRAQPHAIVWVNDGEALPGLDYGVRLADALVALGMTVTIRDMTATGSDETRGDVPDADLHVISGGATSVNDPHSGWMPNALERVGSLLAGAIAGQHYLLGICLGAQMIATTISPGCVRRGPSFEVGMRKLTFADGRVEAVPEFHYEQIDPAPLRACGVTIAASNEHSTTQAFTFGTHVAGVQFHPELTPHDMRDLVRHHAELITRLGADPAEALDSIDAVVEHHALPGMFDRTLQAIGVSRRPR